MLHASGSCKPLRRRHNGCESVLNRQPHDCLLNRLFRRRSKKTSKLRVTGLCAGNSPGTGEFPAQMASNGANVSIWWRHHVMSNSIWPMTYQLQCKAIYVIMVFISRVAKQYQNNTWIFLISPNKILNKQPSFRLFETVMMTSTCSLERKQTLQNLCLSKKSQFRQLVYRW